MTTRYFKQNEISVLTARGMDDIKIAANELKMGNPLVINLSNLNQEEKLWASHFLNGVVYALDGKVFELSPRVLLFAPPNVVVSRD